MGAFIVAGIFFIGTILVSATMLLAAGMSDSPSAASSVPVTSTFVTGTIISALIASSHWLSHIGW